MEPTSTDAQVAQPDVDPRHAAVAEHVRRDSQTLLRPTRLELLDEQGNPLDAGAVRAVLESMRALPKYSDIEYVEAPDGSVHAYSGRHINEKLAATCALASVGDTAATLAATVREESQLYPRPTAVNRFWDQPWLMTPGELEEGLQALENVPQYSDIRRTRASNGALYLYSERFLSADLAEGMAEWDAVGRDLNP